MRQVRVLLIIGVLALFASPALAALADDAFAWFVAPSGSDAAAGTMAAPFLTIQHAADQAVISPMKKRVIVSMGTYAENVVITGGVSLYGGFNAAAGWSRAKANTTTIAPTAWAANTYALFLTGSDNSVVDGFAIVGPDAPDESGGNAVAVRIHASSFVRLRYNEIHAGKGGSGIPAPPQTTPGLDGVAGTNGQPGCQGASCVGGSAGGGGFPGCSANWANGTNGGAGGLGGVNSGRGGYGDGIFGGMPGGSNTLCHLGASGGTSGAPGQNGSVSPGGSGGHRIGVGPFDALGWQAVEGNNGQVSFAGYGGYGGGGGGGGSAAGDASCVVDRGGGGGGGGSGGCPGLGGFAGGGGGASIAVLVGAGNTSYIVGNTIYAGDGGDGARGGDGALGGLGGAGGQGGTGFDDSGPGGNGGSGGRGGQGSGGGGGAGGYSNPILLTSGNLRYANALVAANGGAGGGGGAPFGGSGDPGGFFDIHYNGAASPAFMPILYVTKAGDGAGTVTSDIGWIDCGATCVQAYEGHGTTTVTLTAVPSASPLSVFVGWSGACTHAGPVCMVLMDASANDKTVTANFVKVTWPLSVSLAGNGPGSVGSSPGGIDCGATCGANFDDATAVTLTPNAGAHAVFAGWSGACTGTGACVVTMDAAKSVTASFALVDYSFNVSRSGTGSGGVVSSPAGIDCGLTCSAAFQALTPVTLTATPAVHSSFAGWSGACAGTGVCQVTMDAAKSVTASFAVITHTVTAAKAGTGTGSITSSPAGIGCGATCAASFVEGTQVTLTATPATGSTLTGWSGCDSTLANQCVVTAAPGATATATFTLNQYGVTPTAGPFGTISPDTTVNVNHGATTSFTVTPATGYTASVGGSCGGSLANGVYTTAPITAPCTVSATFAIKQYTVTPSAGAGGTISPDSPQTLNHGATTFFVVTPDPGRLALVGGTCGGALVATVYFTLPVTADCTVSATFPTLQVFELELQGAQVVPSVSSPAFGDGTVTYNPVTHELAFNLGVAGLSGTVGAGSMDVHGPAARGANAPALFTVPDGFPKVVTLTPQQETMLLAGQLYVDIHTSAFPGGQLRAQIDNLGAAQLFELFVSPRGSGEGQVTGTTDTGTVIDCYPDCEARLASGKVVTLTAIAQAGSIFRGWEADCTGTVTTCTVTMNAGKYVRARFDAPAGSDSAALVLTSSASPNPAATGKDVIVTFTVTNNGPAPAAGIYLDVTNPLDAAYVWSSPACELDFDTVYCEAPSGLAAGASTQFRVVYRPAAAGTMEVFAEAFADESDPDTTNNMVTLAIPVSASPAGVPIARYRLYSDVTKEHHFTTDQNEYNVLGTYIGTWVQEGTVGKVLNNPGSFAGVQAVPYYRLYDNNTRWHHWTTDANEFYTLGFVYSGWSMEGVDGYILPSNPPGTTQLYRLNYPALGALHHWTIDANEYNTLITSYGWVGEGGSGFVVQ